MNEIPQVSIVVPVYNSEHYLEQCLNSLAQQTYAAIEVIVVNNNSNDNSQSIIDQYVKNFPDKFISVFEAKPGVSAARNAGIQKSRGRYLSFVDSDDWVDSHLYETCIARIEADHSDLLAFGRFNVDADGQTKKRLPRLKSDVINLNVDTIPLFYMTTFVWDKIFRTDIVIQNKLTFSEDVHYAEDLEFLVKYISHSTTLSVIQRAFYYYQASRADSVTNITSPKIYDIPLALNHIIDYLLEKSIFENYAENLYRVAIGLYIRRLRNFSKTGNKIIQARFVVNFIALFNRHFKSFSVDKDSENRHEKLFRLFRFRSIALAYVFTPNWIKSTVMKVKQVIGSKQKIKAFIYASFRPVVPVRKDTALFVCFFGETMRAAPFHLLKTWLEQDPQKHFLVASNNVEKDQVLFNYFDKSRVTLVSTHSLAYLYWLAAANFLVNNSRLPTYFSKRSKQILLNTWHGTPVKHMGFDISEGAKDVWKNQTQFLMSDVLLFPNAYSKEKMMSAYHLDNNYSGHVVVTPYPQNQVFRNSHLADEIRKKLALGDKKVIAYMPTWRGTSTAEMNIVEQTNYFAHVLQSLCTQLNSDDYIIYYNLHQLTSAKTNDFNAGYAKSFPQPIELYEFLSCVDILITDYSSILFDFCYSGKEVILLIEDYEHYKTTRGLYIDFSDIPCQKAHSLDELISTIKNSTLKGNYSNTDFNTSFCNGEPADSATKIIKLLEHCRISQQPSDDADTYRFEGNTFDTILFLPAMNEFISKRLDNVVIHSGSNCLVVVHANDFDDQYNQLLRANNVKVIVAPGDESYNIVQGCGIWLWNKKLLPKSLAKWAICAEQSRILPRIKAKAVINLSPYHQFQLLAELGNFDS